jgi:molybdopterin/thiamine biosynthesis adenylyltransferase
MQDPHDPSLAAYYKDTIERAKAYIQKKYPVELCTGEEIEDIKGSLSSEYADSQFWKVKLNNSDRDFTFLVAVPETFPDHLPKIYLSSGDFREIPLLPHIDKNRFVCTRDQEIVYVNDKLPGEALEELLGIAVKEILVRGIKKQNINDFMDEFLAYWDEQAKDQALSLFSPIGEITHLKALRLTTKLFDSYYVISDSEEAVKLWLAPFNVKIDTEKPMQALYLPLHDFNPEPFFEKNRSVLSILRNLSNKEHLNALERYLNQDRGTYLILSSLLINGERVLFGWKQFDVSKTINGFRKNHIPIDIRLRYTKDNHIEKIKIKRMDKERILKRGGSGPFLIRSDVSVALVGCGSVGSYLAMSLSRCGLSKLMLVDHEKLEPENVTRHLCGLVEVSKSVSKVDAVKNKLVEHFPYLECDTRHEDFLNVLRDPKELTMLEGYSLIIMATANLAVERRTNYMVKHAFLRCPVAYVWLEPYGVGGHVLYIHPIQGGCYECCFDEKVYFQYSVAKRGVSLFVREAGYQSSFLPYASLDIEQFTSVATRFILQTIEGELSESTLFTWLGDLTAYERLGHQLNDMYVIDSPFTFFKKKIYSREGCSLCGQKKTS